MSDEALLFVPDGDPCPKHGQPTRLILVPHAGLVSQCAGCIDAFFAWRIGQLREAAPALPASAPSRPPVVMTPGERAFRESDRTLELFA